MARFYRPTHVLRKKPRDCGKARNIPRESSAKRKRNTHEPLARLVLSEEPKFESAGGADLILLGSRGLGAWDRFLLGSVSHAVTQHAKCSVEVVRRRSDVSDEKKK
jgi:hypothetical protein